MNKFIFTGNLGKDCQIQATQAGKTICKFSVAVKSGYGDHQKTNWVMCVLFGKRAEGQLPQYLVKGAQVAISGEMTLDEWQTATGQDANSHFADPGLVDPENLNFWRSETGRQLLTPEPAPSARR